MIKRQLSPEVSISAIVQGFWRLDGWNMTAGELARFMNECIDRGVTTFDTAEIYGATLCEKMMGEAFRQDPSIRKRIELVTKTGIFKQVINGQPFGYYDTTYDRVVQSCKESLVRLETDTIDLYLIHREDPLLDVWETARALQDLKSRGLIREAGVSNFDPFKFDALNQAMDSTLVTNQIEWNPIGFEHFRSGMMDFLMAKKIHPMIWSPLAGGRLFSQDELAVKAMSKIGEIAERHGVDPSVIVYAWILYHPVGTAPISGSQSLARLDLAIQALSVRLERYEWFEIYSASGQQEIR